MGPALNDEPFNIDNLEDPGSRYELCEVIGQGVSSAVYRALDSQSGGKAVAVKIQTIDEESFPIIQEEYKILKNLSDHPNIPDFYGIYKKVKENEKTEIWFVMQLCGGGPVTDLVRALFRQTKRMDEIHIAFIVREVLRALVALHENHVMHRDVKASNILLTEAGEVKLVDFGLSRELESTLAKRQTSLGSPCWMAPEVVMCKGADKTEYDNRADTWAIGITAIELGDGQPPLQDMHPTRALFQIVRNPPPTLYRPANWSQNYNDFISECLTKNPEHRPYIIELLEHPFFSTIPVSDLHLNVELKSLIESIQDEDRQDRIKELTIHTGMVKDSQESKPRPLFVEDVAALELATEDNIMHHIESRYRNGKCFSFIGDVLLFLNPNQALDIYRFQHNIKYKCKSRSDNEPHIFSVADSAFQDMLHHGVPQHIVLSGETMSGKTTMFRQLLKQLMFLAKASNNIDVNILRTIDVIHAFGNAATPVNNDSTRHILLSQLTFSGSGKASGAIFWLYQLEKWRVTGNRNPHHANFHIFYYFYHGMEAKGLLDRYHLEPNRDYCYLRRNIDEKDRDPKCPSGPRENVDQSIDKFETIYKHLLDIQFDNDQVDTIWKTLAAIILLGELDYKDDDDGNADINNEDYVDKAAMLLGVESKRLSWALCNYCIVEKETAARRRHSKAEALEARNVLAQTLYSRLVDWIINIINLKFSFSRVVHGDHNCITVLDLFGFECYEENGIEQLFVNSINEQLQYFYNQKIFISEMQEIEEEGLPIKRFNFYDNRSTLDELLNKPLGVIHLLDEANRLHEDSNFIISKLIKKSEGAHIKACNEEEFSIAHYTGKVTYNSLTMVSKNRDFLPPEITEVMRFSTEEVIKQMFTNKLSKTGNVTLMVEKATRDKGYSSKRRWGSALLADNNRNIRRYNTTSRGEFSQTRGIRTAAVVFKAISLELLRVLAEGSTHFVRCIRTDLTGTPFGFQPNIVRQQLRALSVVDTARSKLIGFSHRVSFNQFLERYQFLAFDFDENVEQTKDNCRLLLIRLKMEGWYLGNTKVFLKYYNEEYLSRLYETQVKKIIKVQSMLRSFLAKRSVQHKKEPLKSQSSKTELVSTASCNYTKEEAAIVIQKHLKGYLVRKMYAPLIHPETGKMNEDTAFFIKPYFKKWKNKSVFHVLKMYNAAKHLDLVYFCQQVHLYNQNTVSSLIMCEKENADNKKLLTNVNEEKFIGEEIPAVWKIPFSIKNFPTCDSSLLCESMDIRFVRAKDIPWDDPFKSLDKGCQTIISIDEDSFEIIKRKKHRFTSFIETPFCRDPDAADVQYGKLKFIDTDAETMEELKFSNNHLDKNSRRKIHGYPEESLKYQETSDDWYENQRYMVKTSTKQQNSQTTSNIGLEIKQNHSKVQEIMPKKKPLTERKEMMQSMDENKGMFDYRKNLKPTKIAKKSDPILELEMKGREIARNNSQNEDDPPYNFQAMLRKTGYQDSLKLARKEYSELNFRNDSSNERSDYSKENEEPYYKEYKHNIVQTKNNNNIQNNSQKFGKRKSFSRKDSLDSIKLMLSATKDFMSTGPIIENGNLDQSDGENEDVTRTELVPGLVIIGKITEL